MLVKDSPTHKLISKFRTQLRESVGSSSGTDSGAGAGAGTASDDEGVERGITSKTGSQVKHREGVLGAQVRQRYFLG